MIILVLVAASFILYLLVQVFWSLVLSLVAFIEFRDEFAKASRALQAKREYRGQHFSCVARGMHMMADEGRLVRCEPHYTIEQAREYYFLGIWWWLF